MEKRRARKKWQRTRYPADKMVLNRLTHKLTEAIKKYKQDSISSYLEDLSTDKASDYSLWKATKKIKRPITQAAPLRKSDGTWGRTNEEKGNMFADHLEKTFQPLPRQTDQENILPVDSDEDYEINYVTPKEVKRETDSNINPKKAPGLDLITGKILKEIPRKAIVKLTYLFNAALRMKYVPKQWKIAQVIMIPKPGKPLEEVTSYRPISLLSIISKLFEKLLLKRLIQIIESKRLIPPHQFGFREEHSTIDQVHRITDTIEISLEEKKICSAVFLDVAQAFDRVWHKGLEWKLKRYLPKSYSLLLKSYISDSISVLSKKINIQAFARSMQESLREAS